MDRSFRNSLQAYVACVARCVFACSHVGHTCFAWGCEAHVSVSPEPVSLSDAWPPQEKECELKRLFSENELLTRKAQVSRRPPGWSPLHTPFLSPVCMSSEAATQAHTLSIGGRLHVPVLHASHSTLPAAHGCCCLGCSGKKILSTGHVTVTIGTSYLDLASHLTPAALLLLQAVHVPRQRLKLLIPGPGTGMYRNRM